MNCATHPTVEMTGHEDDLTCPWCDEVQNLTGQIKSLRECIDKTAIKIYRGNQTIHLSGDIGLLEINSGSVTVHNSLSNPVTVPIAEKWIS